MSAPDEQRLLEVLQSWYDARENGEAPDLVALCGGDEPLLARVRSILANDPVSGALGMLRAGAEPAPQVDSGLPVDRLGAFRLKTRIGEGGTGQVFLAEQEELGRPVALKLLRPEMLVDARARARLVREATVASGLDHPSIVPIYGVGEDGGWVYIAMKWLSGPPLDDLAGRLTSTEVARIGAAVARALHEAHASGILHRDVKPANVILDRDTPYLVDFGFARQQSGQDLSRSQAFAGTLAYMSPEQIRGGELDARTDVFSLGATLYELATGRRACPGEQPEDVIQQILLRDPPRLHLDRRDRDLEAIIERALERDVDRRFPSAEAMAEDLERFVRGEPVRFRPLGPAARAWRTMARRPRTTIATLVLVAVASASLIHASVQRSRQLQLLDERQATARALLESGDLTGAERTLDELAAVAGGAPRTVDLRAELEARLAVETLLDQLMGRRETQPLDLVRTLVRRVEDARAATIVPRESSLALSLAVLHLEGAEAAYDPILTWEKRFGPSRGGAALLAVAEGRPIERELAAVDALDHVVTFLALRMAAADLAERRAELELANSDHGDDFRVRLAWCFQQLDEEDYEPAALSLSWLPDPHRPNTVVRRTRMYVEMLCGRWDEAQLAYESLPAEAISAWDETNLLTLLAFRGDATAVEERLAAARVRWPDDPGVALFAARWESRQGRRDAAKELFEHVRDTAQWTRLADEARAALLMLAVNDYGELSPDERRSHPELVDAIRTEAEDLIAHSRTDWARSHAHRALAEIPMWDPRPDDRIGLLVEAVDHLRDAVRDCQVDGASRLRLGETTFRLIDGLAQQLELAADPYGPLSFRQDRKDVHRLMQLARRSLDEALQGERRGPLPLSRSDKLRALSWSVALAAFDGDVTVVRELLPELAALGEELGWPEPEWQRRVAGYQERWGVE